MKWIAVLYDDLFNTNDFGNKEFDSFEDAWDYIYNKFPIIEFKDGTTDDREDVLDSYTVIPKTKTNRQ